MPGIRTQMMGLLGIEHPIVGGCMMHISGPDFAAAISNAGALGLMSSVMFGSEPEFRDALRRLRSLTDRPCGVNLSLLPAAGLIDNDMYVRVITEEGGIPVVETSGYRPSEELLARLKEAGITTMHKCTCIAHARIAQEMGVDVVTLFGREGGGHIGRFGLGTMTLVPGAVAELDVPVLAAGGIVNGRALAAALALGAAGVMMGTRLLLTQECPVPATVKRALLRAAQEDTVEILGTIHNPLRAWSNPAARRVASLEAEGAPLADILEAAGGGYTQRMLREGDAEAGVIACSQGVGMIREIKPLEQVIRETVDEAADVIRDLIWSVRA